MLSDEVSVILSALMTALESQYDNAKADKEADATYLAGLLGARLCVLRVFWEMAKKDAENEK